MPIKKLDTPKMRTLLREGLKKAARVTSPSDGYLRPLVYRRLKNGWHYQVDFIHDTRCDPARCVTVYAFRPSKSQGARLADYKLSSPA